MTFVRWPRTFGLCHRDLICSIIIIAIGNWTHALFTLTKRRMAEILCGRPSSGRCRRLVRARRADSPSGVHFRRTSRDLWCRQCRSRRPTHTRINQITLVASRYDTTRTTSRPCRAGRACHAVLVPTEVDASEHVSCESRLSRSSWPACSDKRDTARHDFFLCAKMHVIVSCRDVTWR